MTPPRCPRQALQLAAVISTARRWRMFFVLEAGIKPPAGRWSVYLRRCLTRKDTAATWQNPLVREVDATDATFNRGKLTAVSPPTQARGDDAREIVVSRIERQGDERLGSIGRDGKSFHWPHLKRPFSPVLKHSAARPAAVVFSTVRFSQRT